jgi:PKD repeat protein
MRTIKLCIILIAFCCIAKLHAQPVQCRAEFTYSLGSAEGTGINVDFQFVPVNGDAVLSYEWNFGDPNSIGSNPNTSSAENPVHLYSQSGSYTVCLTISQVNGCSSTACDTISIPVIDPGPCYGLSAIWTDTIKADGKVEFGGMADNRNTVVYDWNFGDGSTKRGIDVSHTYTSSGTYDVCLIAKIKDNRNCADTSCADVTISLPCDLNVAWTASEATPGTVTYTVTNPVSTQKYKWLFGDGTTDNGKTVTHTYRVYRYYDVCLVTSVTGSTCRDTSCTIIDVGGSPIACVDSALIKDTVACPTIDMPVCGCNGVTYSNACVAEYYGGVTSWTSGACSSNPVPVSGLRGSGSATGINNVVSDKFLVSIYPNPAGSNTTIAYSLNSAALVNVDILDMLGHTVALVYSGNQQAGNQTVSWNTASAANGIYIVRINVDSKFYTQRLSIIH